jgi:hypothetical protein
MATSDWSDFLTVDWLTMEHISILLSPDYILKKQKLLTLPYIEEEQTTQWPKEKVQRTNNDLQNIHIKLKIE